MTNKSDNIAAYHREYRRKRREAGGRELHIRLDAAEHKELLKARGLCGEYYLRDTIVKAVRYLNANAEEIRAQYPLKDGRPRFP